MLLIDDETVLHTLTENVTHSSLHLMYLNGTHTVEIIGNTSVRLLSDVNDDGNVDNSDLIIVGMAPWSSPEFDAWRYNLYADVTGDGVIDGADKITVSIHLGKTYQ